MPTGEVVGVLRARGADHVAIISEADATELSSNPTRSASFGSVLAIPSDRRAPKLRLRTRRAREYVGQRLLVRVDGWRATSRHPDARVLRVLGHAGDADAETAALLARFDIPDAPFTPAALANLPPEGVGWTVSADEVARRRDMRGARTMSIDPPGCVDVDDAVSVSALPDGAGWEVGVHIADVSSFVREGTALDLEARERGTTVYLVDRRLDMLPALLSENLASLLAGRDRLATSCVWRVAPDMTSLAPPWFGKTVIRSNHQLHYYQAQAIADGAPPPSREDFLPPKETARVAVDLAVVFAFAAARHDARTRAGAVELASAELRFETTSDGAPSEVLTKGEVPMMRVVAELMIAANAAVAARVRDAFPSSALLRRHAPPRTDGFELLAGLCDAEGVRLDASSGETLSRSLDEASRLARDPAAAELFRGTATRAMSEAQYVSAGEPPPPDGGGHAHYGLALEHYTHFTSPIRRYADVVVHRQLHAALEREEKETSEGDGNGSGGKATEAPGKRQTPRNLTRTDSPSVSAAARVSLSHASVAPIAAALNERTRASKRAQQRCAELYLLALLRERPTVEPALVHDVRDDGALVFFPRFHLRGAVRLAGREGAEGAVLPAVRTTWIETNAPAGSWGARRHLRAVPPDPDPNVRLERVGRSRYEDENVGAPGVRYVDARTGRPVPNAPELRLLTRVWVQMSAEDHLARGPRLVLTLLDPTHPDAAAAAERERESERERRTNANRRTKIYATPFETNIDRRNIETREEREASAPTKMTKRRTKRRTKRTAGLLVARLDARINGDARRRSARRRSPVSRANSRTCDSWTTTRSTTMGCIGGDDAWRTVDRTRASSAAASASSTGRGRWRRFGVGGGARRVARRRRRWWRRRARVRERRTNCATEEKSRRRGVTRRRREARVGRSRRGGREAERFARRSGVDDDEGSIS